MRVCVESPYAGDVLRNVDYARRCMADSLERGEAPFLGHLLYTQVLDDTVPAQRGQGIHAHLRWLRMADIVAVYVDYGVTPGMRSAIDVAKWCHIRVLERRIGPNP